MYSSDGRLLAYPTDDLLPSIAVRDAHTLARLATLILPSFQSALMTPDLHAIGVDEWAGLVARVAAALGISTT